MNGFSLDAAVQHLVAPGSRIVGWGTGSVYDYFQRLNPVRLAYLVDNDRSRWGGQRHGVDVCSPARLAAEGADTFVVIYSSAWLDIQRQILSSCGLRSLPASAIFADADVRARHAWAEQLLVQPPRARSPEAANTIVVQGPVVPEMTARVLQLTTALHPHDLVILSTWRDTDPDHLAQVRPLADEVVLSERPAIAGMQNRNCQIVSTRAGIDRAIAGGAKRVLKIRTDLVVLESAVFDRAARWLDRLDRDRLRASGLRQRLIVPSTFTRKYLLYHPSDLVMLGDAEDMACYWSAPLDPRSGDLLSPEWLDRSLTSANLDGAPTESYLGTHFCRAINRPLAATVADSWAFYRDLFMVVDNDWFDLLWFKNLAIPDATIRSGVRQTVSGAFWEQLRNGHPGVAIDLAAMNPDTTTLRALTGCH